MKLCSVCRTAKATGEFHRNQTSRDGYYSACKLCVKARRNGSPAVRARQFRKYNVSLVWYLAQYEHQQGRCAICREPQPRRALSVDHDHQTGKARELLCVPCNTIVGSSPEQPERLRAAIGYLDRHMKG